MKSFIKTLMLLIALVTVSCEKETPPDPTTFTVTFDSDGGSEISSQSIYEGEKVTRPVDPTKIDNVFAGWFTSDSYAWDFDNDVVKSDITLYAKWTSSLVVVFNTGDGSSISALTNIESGSTITEPAEPTLEGFVFCGWFKEDTYTTEWNFTRDRVVSSMILYAKWVSEDTKVSYTFVDSKNSTETLPVEVNVGTTIPEPIAPTAEGFDFLGWSKSDSADDIWNFATNKITEDITLTAQWEQIFTISFITNQEFSVEDQTVKNGEKIDSPLDDNHEYNDQIFVAWYLDSEFSIKYDLSNTTYTTDLTLYAKWESPVTVIFMSEEAVFVSYNVVCGECVKEPSSNPSASNGWTFVGWYTSEGVIWNFSDPVLEDMTLTAKFEDKPIEVEVSISSSNSSEVYIEQENIPSTFFYSTSGSTIPSKYHPTAEPTSYTHNFTKWVYYDYSTYAQKEWDFDSSIVPSVEYIYIYAIWEAKGDGSDASLYNRIQSESNYTTDSYTQESIDALNAVLDAKKEIIRDTDITADQYDAHIQDIEDAVAALVLRDFGSTATFEYETWNMLFDRDGNIAFVLNENGTGSGSIAATALDAAGEISNAQIEPYITSGSDLIEVTDKYFVDAAVSTYSAGRTYLSIEAKAAGEGTILLSTANGYSETKSFKVYSFQEATTEFDSIYDYLATKENYTPDDSDLFNIAYQFGYALGYNWDDEKMLELEDIEDAIPFVMTIENTGGIYYVVVDDEKIEATYTVDGTFPYGSYSFEETYGNNQTYTVTIILEENGNCTVLDSDSDEYTEYYTFEIQTASSTTTEKVIWMYWVGDGDTDIVSASAATSARRAAATSTNSKKSLFSR